MEWSWVTWFTQNDQNDIWLVEENAAFHIVFHFFTNYRRHLCGGGLCMAHEIKINKAADYVVRVQEPFLLRN